MREEQQFDNRATDDISDIPAQSLSRRPTSVSILSESNRTTPPNNNANPNARDILTPSTSDSETHTPQKRSIVPRVRVLQGQLKDTNKTTGTKSKSSLQTDRHPSTINNAKQKLLEEEFVEKEIAKLIENVKKRRLELDMKHDQLAAEISKLAKLEYSKKTIEDFEANKLSTLFMCQLMPFFKFWLQDPDAER